MHINDGLAGGPLVWFGTDKKALILSPLNHFMSASLSQHGSNVYGGIMGGMRQTH